MKKILFADRVSVQIDSNLEKLENSVKCEMTKVIDWLTANKLSLNISKTKYMLIMGVGTIFSRREPLRDFSYIFQGGAKSDEIWFFPPETRKTTFFAENFKIQ